MPAPRLDVGNAAADSQIIGTGDFTGNGTADVLFENGGGGVVDWILSNGHYAGYNNVGTAPGYTFAGTGDFTGNGTDDILWQNNSIGEVIAWLMQNGQYAGYNDLGNAAGWKVVGTGDYNGKGTADVLLQNNTTGANTDSTISNARYAGYQLAIGTAPGWTITSYHFPLPILPSRIPDPPSEPSRGWQSYIGCYRRPPATREAWYPPT